MAQIDSDWDPIKSIINFMVISGYFGENIMKIYLKFGENTEHFKNQTKNYQQLMKNIAPINPRSTPDKSPLYNIIYNNNIYNDHVCNIYNNIYSTHIFSENSFSPILKRKRKK